MKSKLHFLFTQHLLFFFASTHASLQRFNGATRIDDRLIRFICTSRTVRELLQRYRLRCRDYRLNNRNNPNASLRYRRVYLRVNGQGGGEESVLKFKGRKTRTPIDQPFVTSDTQSRKCRNLVPFFVTSVVTYGDKPSAFLARFSAFFAR